MYVCYICINIMKIKNSSFLDYDIVVHTSVEAS